MGSFGADRRSEGHRTRTAAVVRFDLFNTELFTVDLFAVDLFNAVEVESVPLKFAAFPVLPQYPSRHCSTLDLE